MVRVVVVGASGFVGQQVCVALERRGVEVLQVRAPRLPGTSDPDALAQSFEADAGLAASFSGADAVVNAAGDPDASSRDIDQLTAANGALPGVIGRIAAAAGVPRYVHVSSAVVQGRATVLDASDTFDAFSPYAQSKVAGERTARRHGPAETVCYRPPSVHHESRRVTQLTARIASSGLSSVAAPGSQPTPQALAANVGDAVAALALSDVAPPAVVIHPWEGITCEQLLELLGGRRPKRLPRVVARVLVRLLAVAGAVAPSLAANARRIEMVWFGQGQDRSWLTDQGWAPPEGESGWVALRDRLADQRSA